MDDFQYVICAVWGILILLCLCSCYSPIIKMMTLHGKLLNKGNINFMVPKRWFKLFYLFGAIWNLFILLVDESYVRKIELMDGWTVMLPLLRKTGLAILCLSLLECHLLRRLYESLVITEFGDSKMHAMAILLGIFHYMLASVSIAFYSRHESYHASSSFSVIFVPLGLYVFFKASYHQFKCNEILANLKRASHKYVVPTGNWFDSILCPLYTAEILIYFSFVLITELNITTIMLFFWVAVNQSVSAVASKRWYNRNFPETQRRRWTLFPSIW